jgi:hypothetical protein
MDQREVHSGLLEHGALTQHARAAAATAGTRPRILDKTGLTVGLFDRLADAVLQGAQELFDVFDLLAFHRLVRLESSAQA